MGADGGAVRLIDTNDDGEPDELYIADNSDPTQAIKVWRFNYNGWAASKNGYSGPFEFGATLEDGLLANFVTAAQLVAGTIKSQDNGKTFFLDLDNGVLKMDATELSISNKTVDEITQSKAADAVNAQTQSDIFNKLTENGKLKGIYMEGGELFINASYLKSGIIDAAVVQVVNLVAERLKSVLESELSELNIDGSVLKFLSNGNETIKVCNEFEGSPILYMKDFEEGTSTQVSAGELSPHHLKLGGTSLDPIYEVSTVSGRPTLRVGGVRKRLSWKDNGDGTHTLIGE